MYVRTYSQMSSNMERQNRSEGNYSTYCDTRAKDTDNFGLLGGMVPIWYEK